MAARVRVAVLWLWLVLGLVAAPAAAWADGGSPADDAADDPFVPLEEMTALTIPEDELSFAPELLDLPIVRIEVRVTGKRWSSKASVSSVKFGEKLTAEAGRRAMRELGDKGGFAKLAVEAERAGSGVVLRVVAVPSRTVSAVQIEGGTLDRAGTLRATQLVTGGDITEAELDKLPERIGEYYRKHGFPRASITVRPVELDDPLTVLLVVTIDPKEPRLVTQRVFVIEPAYDKHVGDAKYDYAVKAGDRLDEGALEEADRGLAQALREAHFYKARISHRVKQVGAFSFLYVYVESGPKLVPVFEGNQRFDATQLTEALELDKGQSSSTDELRGKLEKHYQAHGFLDAEVAVGLRESRDVGLEFLVFDIREHERIAVTRRIFTCLPAEIDPDDVGRVIDDVLTTELPDETFLSVPAPRTIDALVGSTESTGSRPAPLELTPASVYNAEVYAKALKRVREVFLAKGYLNAAIGPITVVRARCSPSSPAGACIEEPLPEVVPACKTSSAGLPLPEPTPPSDITCVPDSRKGIRCSSKITVRLPMQLGPVTRVWDVAFEGNRHATGKVLAEVAKLEMGEPLGVEALEESKKRIAEYYQDRGYAYVDVASEIDLSPDKSRARVRFVVTERDLVFIDEIEIEGAKRTDHALILRRLAFKKGDVYSREKVRLSEERLATLGTFASASVTLAEPEVVSRKKRVIVRVAEYASQYIDPKVGFSTGEGVRFGFEYGHRNIASLGISLTLRIQLSYLFDFMILDSDVEENLAPLSASQRLERRNSVRVNFPEIGLGPLVSFGIEAIDVRDNQRDFGLTRDAIVPSLTYRPFRELTGTLSASVELNDEQIFSGDSVNDAIQKNPALEQLLRFPDGTTFAVAQRIGIAWDRRD
ncbi:MAG: outer membrane protein assembly factor, partial [Myxococcales bacterium]|nr:outer membrane protein assembly factor [Myxococcales bacterium]